MRRISTWVLVVGITTAAACGDDAEGDGLVTLTQSFTGLEPLGAGYVYEGWLLAGGKPVSSGRFEITTDGKADPDSFDLPEDNAGASAFVLTIEPAVGDPPEPSNVHVLAGDFNAGEARLSIAHSAALGTDFASAAGSYLLKTPTSAADDDDDLGIWFLDPTGAPDPTLMLPALPSAWVYEGWVVVDGTPVSTGRFRQADAADSDGVGASAGTDGCSTNASCPPFPGQDFIHPRRSLIGAMAVISVEPEPDDSPAPFGIKPLIDPDVTMVAAPSLQPLTAAPSTAHPRGVVTLR